MDTAFHGGGTRMTRRAPLEVVCSGVFGAFPADHERYERQLKTLNPASVAVRTFRCAVRMLCLLLLPIALAAGLLGGGSQALADDSPTGGDGSGTSEVSDRTRALDLWSTGGPEVRAAAEVALMGSDDDVRHFLDQTASDAAFQDERVSVAQLASVGG